MGADVPAEKFVNKMETADRILGLSGFLFLTFNSMKEMVQAVEAAGLRDKTKIGIGGDQIDDDVRK